MDQRPITCPYVAGEVIPEGYVRFSPNQLVLTTVFNTFNLGHLPLGPGQAQQPAPFSLGVLLQEAQLEEFPGDQGHNPHEWITNTKSCLHVAQVPETM